MQDAPVNAVPSTLAQLVQAEEARRDYNDLREPRGSSDAAPDLNHCSIGEEANTNPGPITSPDGVQPLHPETTEMAQDAHLAQCINHLRRNWPAVMPIIDNYEQHIGQSAQFEW